MLRGLLFCAALVAVVGSTTYGSQNALPLPQEQSPAVPGGAPPNGENPPVKRSVAGVYLCEGANPDGSPYQGLVEIVAVDNTYLVHWMMADGAQVLGVGIRNSDVLSVSYFGGTPAVVVYRIDGDRLVGEWTMGGAEGMLYSETLTRMPEATPHPQKRKPARTRPAVGSRSV
jgi:hypothetical protein